ncbi:MAG: hypothetical protein GF317_20775 [Candidatus Lokiarchaeota archaeon]|nr:hypothetical protein [Candidatus Lokiarchaeota archaeon]
MIEKRGVLAGIIVGLSVCGIYILNMSCFAYLIPYFWLYALEYGILSIVPITFIILLKIITIYAEFKVTMWIGNYIVGEYTKKIEEEKK